jgi:hypothetical protein
MSESPVRPISPFATSTTPAIEQANRLISVRENPGYRDLIRLSQQMVDSAQAQCTDFGGWDPMQVMVLKVRAQAAKEHHNLFFARVQEVIQFGLDEMQAQLAAMPDKTPQEVLEHGDFVRQRVLENFDERDTETRTPGSY